MSSSHWIMEVSFTSDGRREEVLKDRSFVGRSVQEDDDGDMATLVWA